MGTHRITINDFRFLVPVGCRAAPYRSAQRLTQKAPGAFPLCATFALGDTAHACFSARAITLLVHRDRLISSKAMTAKIYPIIKPLATLVLLLPGSCIPAFSCTCAWSTKPAADYGASVVLRGVVTEKKVLPARDEMKGRRRYAIKFRVSEYWKGPRQPTVVVYGLDDGTDCLGGSRYEIGKDYLVFASEQPSRDVFLGSTTFWYGWTDVQPKGTPMLMDTACAPNGETSKIFVRDALHRLGKGSPSTDAK